MNDEEQNNIFSVTGLPSNDPFEVEVPDTKKRAISRSAESMPLEEGLQAIKNLTPEAVMKSLPPEVVEELQNEAKVNGTTLEDAILQSINIINDALNFGDLSNLENAINQLTSEETEDNTEEKEGDYVLGSSEYLHPEDFGSIKCSTSTSLYNDFIEKFGTDSSKYVDETVGVSSFVYSDLTIKLANIPIKSWRYFTSTDNFILFYAEPVDEESYGYFVSVINDNETNTFTAFIPEFGNTFKVNADGTVGLYAPKKDPKLFLVDNNGYAEFSMFDLNTLLFSTKFYLAPYKNVILNPKKFGTIKNVIAPVMKQSSMLKVGNIISNESPEAILLKKDADLPLDETVFPLYINFGNTISEESLKIIQQILFKVDFNNCKIFDYCELKWTPDNKLYVSIDLGEF